MSLKARAALIVATACLAGAPTAPAALASGGSSGGGGGGAGTAGTGGGGTSQSPTAGGGGGSVRSCTISTFANLVGTFETWAAVWTGFAIPQGCPNLSAYHTVFTNQDTGQVEFQAEGSTGVSRSSGANGFTAGTSGIQDYDFAHFSTPYHVHMEIDNSQGQEITEADADVVTPDA